jgi:uncharacterized protein YjiK
MKTTMLSFFSFYLILLSILSSLTTGCTSEPADKQTAGSQEAGLQKSGLQKVGQMPKQVDESSGIETTDEAGVFLTHNDAGGKAALYKINEQGKLLETLPVPGAKNVDWEDLTRDSNGHLYIGDFGNNDNKRQNLRIYKVRLQDMGQAEEIRFRYEDQQAFPPPKEEQNFDCEAFFWHNQKLYLITKDRGSKSAANMYEVADQPGEHVARKVDAFETTDKITSAAISPSGQRLALLSNKKLHLFDLSDSKKPGFFDGKKITVSIKETGQAEGVVFLDNQNLLITDEEGGIYRYGLREEGQ